MKPPRESRAALPATEAVAEPRRPREQKCAGELSGAESSEPSRSAEGRSARLARRPEQKPPAAQERPGVQRAWEPAAPLRGWQEESPGRASPETRRTRPAAEREPEHERSAGGPERAEGLVPEAGVETWRRPPAHEPGPQAPEEPRLRLQPSGQPTLRREPPPFPSLCPA